MCDVVAALCQMAVKLGITTIGEGVESAQQVGLLRSLGCDAVQGFLYSPAVPIDQVDLERTADDRG